MKRDSNIAERNKKALRVGCSYCGAGIGMKCWFTRSPEVRITGLTRHHSHKQRIKASWRLTNGTSERKVEMGQRVRMTKEALDAGLDGPIAKRNTGVVKGFPAQGIGDIRLLVYVLRDGNKTKQSYHMDFWEPANEPDSKN